MTRIPHVLSIAALLTIGASPAPPPDAAAIHRRLLTLDTHLDTPANFERSGWDMADRHSLDADISQVDLPRMRDGGLDGGFFAIYTPQGPRTPEATAQARDMALERAAAIASTVARLKDRMALATTVRDARRIAASGRVVVYQSIENAQPLAGDPALLPRFAGMGVRMLGLVHFLNNDLADSSTDPKGAEWNGLSPLGRRFVAEANRLGMILDASHASDAALDQMIALSTTPVILSHSGCKAVYDHPRNVDDARLKALAARGGVIQINAFGAYVARVAPNPERDAALRELQVRAGDIRTLSPTALATLLSERNAILARYPGDKPSFDAFMAHLLHALRVVGPDHVGIGLDWDGGGGVEGMTDVVAIPRITEALLKAGYDEHALAKIWSGNVLRVLAAAERAAAKGGRKSSG